MKFYRLLKILYVIARFRLDKLIPIYRLPSYGRFALYLIPLWLFPIGEKPRGARLRLALESLGPIFVKFGQILSTRRDLFPADIIDELQKLQNQVPPFPSALARETVEKSLNKPLNTIFKTFSDEPLASASVAQVHAAELPTGESVIVKIIRPGIQHIIHIDTALMKSFARFLMWFPELRRLRPLEVVRDYRLTLFDELDLHKEAANAAQLRRNFLNSPLLYVPVIYWPLTRKNILVEERIHGIPITDLKRLHASTVNLKVLAERGVEIFFTQVFRDNFFHADMHPGNIFVDAHNPQLPSYIAIDCGIVGSLTPEDQDYLARNLLAFFQHDYDEVAMLHIRSGWVDPKTRVNEFASAVRSVCEPLLEKPLKDISFGQALLGLFQTARRFNMQVQPQLVLLQKTLLNIEGLGRTLYPDLDLWHSAKPFLEKWMRQRSGPAGIWRAFKYQAPDLAQSLPELPILLHQSLTRYLSTHSAQVLNPSSKQTLSGLKRFYPLSRSQRLGIVLLLSALFWQSLVHWWQQTPWVVLSAALIGLILVIYR